MARVTSLVSIGSKSGDGRRISSVASVSAARRAWELPKREHGPNVIAGLSAQRLTASSFTSAPVRSPIRNCRTQLLEMPQYSA